MNTRSLSCLTMNRRRVLFTALTAVLIALSSMATAPRPASSAIAHCTSAHLRLSFVTGEAATSHRFWTLALTNTGTATCRLQGFPGVGLLARSGRVLSTTVARQTQFPRPPVLVRPGKRGYFTFEYVVRGPCGAQFFTVYGLQVIAPNERHQVTPRIHSRIDVCSVAVAGPPTVTPMRAGPSL